MAVSPIFLFRILPFFPYFLMESNFLILCINFLLSCLRDDNFNVPAGGGAKAVADIEDAISTAGRVKSIDMMVTICCLLLSFLLLV